MLYSFQGVINLSGSYTTDFLFIFDVTKTVMHVREYSSYDYDYDNDL